MNIVRKNALKVVIDTNIWVSVFIKPQGFYAQIVADIVEKAELITSEEILAEVRGVVLRKRIREKYQLAESYIDRLLEKIRIQTTQVTDLPVLNVVADDPDDDIILATAIKAKADYLLSYDPHLLYWDGYQGLPILTPKQFISVLEQVR